MNIDIKLLRKRIKEVPLTDRERKIVDYRFGLTDNIVHTLEQTGQLFGLTRERIRQIETKVLMKLKVIKN